MLKWQLVGWRVCGIPQLCLMISCPGVAHPVCTRLQCCNTGEKCANCCSPTVVSACSWVDCVDNLELSTCTCQVSVEGCEGLGFGFSALAVTCSRHQIVLLTA